MWTESQDYIGAWCCSAFDSDRAVRASAKRSWDGILLRDRDATDGAEDTSDAAQPQGIKLVDHAASILDFSAGNIFSGDQPGDSAAVADHALVKSQSVLAVSYLLQNLPSPLPLPEKLLGFFVNEDLWDMLRLESPGHLRRALYELLGSAADRAAEGLLEREDGIDTIAATVLENCWQETDGWPGIIGFLRSQSVSVKLGS